MIKLILLHPYNRILSLLRFLYAVSRKYAYDILLNEKIGCKASYGYDKKWHLTSVVFLPQIYNPIKSWEKYQTSLSTEAPYNTPDQYFKTAKVIKTRNVPETVRATRSLRRPDKWKWCSLLDGVLQQKKDPRQKRRKSE